ncbi:MAG: hypothetical protein ACI9F9_000507 [Candidatus Paceibacteria bacterium]|jgi:hypothetical protein
MKKSGRRLAHGVPSVLRHLLASSRTLLRWHELLQGSQVKAHGSLQEKFDPGSAASTKLERKGLWRPAEARANLPFRG